MRTARLWTVSQHVLDGVYPSMHWAGVGVSAQGVCLGWVSAQGGVADTPCEQNDRQV